MNPLGGDSDASSMDHRLRHDLDRLPDLLGSTLEEAVRFLGTLHDRPVVADPSVTPDPSPPDEGAGFDGTLDRFRTRWMPHLSGSAGPRYLAFVTGGSTPAALAGDWLTSAIDQNASDELSSGIDALELETVGMLAELLGLGDGFSGRFVTGATMSSFVSLAQARQWAAAQHGVDAARDGLHTLPPVPVLSGTAHSSIGKALAMLGMGRRSLTRLPTLPGREAVDVAALRSALEDRTGTPCVVVANAGTVNTVDFDDLAAVAELKEQYGFFLHVDAAFGGFAALSPDFAPLVAGLSAADTVTVDAHKWLNVPYDSGVQLTRHPRLQAEVFQNSAAYLGALDLDDPPPIHLTPENSRRVRALPTWFTLQAYGRAGHREIVERNVRAARRLGDLVDDDPEFRLLAPVRLNVVCFTLAGEPTSARVAAFLQAVRETGDTYLTPTELDGTPAVRAAFSNWRTTDS
ncbi:MAG: pyridoxal phosphate-dependent decarboxylase family protein, partial [Dermatophilaceae bacterium]